MGLLFDYFRSIARSRRAAARRASASSRRRLTFERCESRIALSTNDVTSGPAEASLQLEMVAENSSLLSLRGNGGMISVSFMAADVTSWRETTQNTLAVDLFNQWKASSGVADTGQLDTSQLDVIRFNAAGLKGAGLNAAGLNTGNLDAVLPVDPVNFTIRNEAMTLLSGSIAHDVLGGQVDLKDVGGLAQQGWSKSDDFNLFDSTSDGEYGMKLGDTELASGSANGDIAIIPPPTEPSGLNRGSEGGQIALSPFVAPTGLTLSDGQGSSSLARAGQGAEPIGVDAARTTGDGARAEGLRGRAVVYEVADAETAAAANEAQQIAADREHSAEELIEAYLLAGVAALEGHNAGPVERAHVRQTVDSRSGDEAPFDPEAAIESLPGDLELNGAITLASLGVDLNPSFNGGDVDSLDAAFADWQERDAEGLTGPHEEMALPTAMSDRRMLGVGVAMALTAVPLRKAWRRRNAPPVGTQLPREGHPTPRRDG